MNPIILAGPAVEPLSLGEMKGYLRLDGEDEDDLVTALIVAARVTVELQTRLCLVTQSWRYALAEWPPDRRVRLPLHPVSTIDAVTVSASEGGAVSLAPGLFRLDLDGDVSRLVVGQGAPPPGGLSPRIEIDVTCGFGEAAEAVPEPLRLAIRRLVAFWFEHRGDERGGEASVPPDIAALVAPYIRRRLA